MKRNRDKRAKRADFRGIPVIRKEMRGFVCFFADRSAFGQNLPETRKNPGIEGVFAGRHAPLRSTGKHIEFLWTVRRLNVIVYK